MAYLGSFKVDDFITFYCNTHNAGTGEATDADALPAYMIYEDETTTPIATGSMALIDTANTTGFYSERVQLTAAIGYEKGKCYSIYIAAAVSSVSGTMNHTFQIEAEVDANTVSPTVIPANVTQWLGTSVPSPGTAGVPSVDTVRVGNTIQTARNLGQGIPNAVPGAAGGLFIAGTNAATTVTTSFTTTFTGNLTGSVGSVTTVNGLSAGAIDSILDDAVDGTYTLRQLLRLLGSALGAKVAGAGTTTITFRDLADTKDRITATVDADGNRTVVTLDLT